MKNIIKSLVDDYKTVLAVKFSDVYPNVRLRLQMNVVIVILISMSIFIGIGFLLNQIENLYFMYFIVNTIILGSFILNQYVSEIKIQNKHKVQYSLFVAVLYPSLLLASILFYSNALIFILLFDYSNTLLLGLFNLSLAIIPTYIVLAFYRQIRLIEAPRIIRNVIYIYSLFLFLFYVLNIPYLERYYFTSVFIIITIYIFKYLITFIPNFKRIERVLSIIIATVFFIGLLVNLDDLVEIVKHGAYNHKVEDSELNIVAEYESNNYIWKLFSLDDYLINLRRYSEFFVYDHDTELIKTFEIDSYKTFIYEGKLYYNKVENNNTQVYQLNDNLEFIFLTEINGSDFNILYPNDDHYIATRGRENEVYHIDTYQNGERIDSTLIQGYDGYVINGHGDVLMSKDHINFQSFESYESYIIIESDLSVSPRVIEIFEIDTYLTDGQALLSFECEGCAVKNFSIENDKIIINYEQNDNDTYKEGHMSIIFDISGKELSRGYIKELFIHNNHIIAISRNQFSGFDRLLELDYNQPFVSIFEDVEIAQRDTALFIVIGMSLMANYIILPGSWWRNTW